MFSWGGMKAWRHGRDPWGGGMPHRGERGPHPLCRRLIYLSLYPSQKPQEHGGSRGVWGQPQVVGDACYRRGFSSPLPARLQQPPPGRGLVPSLPSQHKTQIVIAGGSRPNTPTKVLHCFCAFVTIWVHSRLNSRDGLVMWLHPWGVERETILHQSHWNRGRTPPKKHKMLFYKPNQHFSRWGSLQNFCHPSQDLLNVLM